MQYKLEPVVYATGKREELVFESVGEKNAFAKVSQTLLKRIAKRPGKVPRETPLERTQLPPGAGEILEKHGAALRRVVGLSRIERQKTGGPIVVTVVPLPALVKAEA